jgi:hypothetical protein
VCKLPQPLQADLVCQLLQVLETLYALVCRLELGDLGVCAEHLAKDSKLLLPAENDEGLGLWELELEIPLFPSTLALEECRSEGILGRVMHCLLHAPTERQWRVALPQDLNLSKAQVLW